MILKVVVLIIFVALFSKWIIFVLLSPVIRYKNRKVSLIYENEASNVPVSEVVVKIGKLRCLRSVVSGFIRYIDFQVGMIPSHHIRDFIYRNIFCVDLQKKAVIYFGAEIRSHPNLHIGEGSIIGDRAILDARSGIYIGRNVNFSSNVKIWTYQHDHSSPNFDITKEKTGSVKIGDRVWIGPDVTILHSVDIGEGAVVAAGSVVTKNIPPYSIVAGIPAKVIGGRNPNLLYEFSGNYIKFY